MIATQWVTPVLGLVAVLALVAFVLIAANDEDLWS